MAEITDTKDIIDRVINDGSAYEILLKMIYAHGGCIDNIKDCPKAMKDISCDKSGYISYVDTKKLGNIINFLYRKKNRIDNQAGFKIIKKNGSFVNRNDVIAQIFCSDRDCLLDAEKMFKKAYIISNDKIKLERLIKE